MSMWGATLFLAAALLGGTAHPGLASDTGQPQHSRTAIAPALLAAHRAPAIAQQSPVSTPALTTTSAVLQQVSAHTWKTTVLLNNTADAGCPSFSSFVLETNQPNGVYFAVKPLVPVKSTSNLDGASCAAVTLTFSGVAGVPESAALELEEPGVTPSSVQLSVSRNVSLVYYVVIPMGAGLLMAVILLVLIMYYVKIYNSEGSRLRPFRSPKGQGKDGKKNRGEDSGTKPELTTRFWQRTVSASGAWTVSDSWATNIATVIAVLATVLTTTTAANSLFPGVALDRFALVNAMAGGIVAAAPLVFGAFYAKWITKYPGLTTDCLVAPTVRLAADCQVKLEKETTVAERSAGRGLSRVLRKDLPRDSCVRLKGGNQGSAKRGTSVIPTAFGSVSPSAGTPLTLLVGTVTSALGSEASTDTGQAIQPRVVLGKATKVSLPAKTPIALTHLTSGWWARLSNGQNVTIDDSQPDQAASHGLSSDTSRTLPYGALAMLHNEQSAVDPAPPVTNATLLGGTRADISGDKADKTATGTPAAADKEVTFPSGVKVTLPEGVNVTWPAAETPAGVGSQPGGVRGNANAEPATVLVTAPSGAEITVPGGAALGNANDPAQWPIRVKDGKKIEVPPASSIKIELAVGTVMALPGGSDVVVGGVTAFTIACTGGVLAIAGGDIMTAAKATAGIPHDKDGDTDPADVALQCPVYGIAPAGAKVTVAGTSDVKLPVGVALTAPRRMDVLLLEERHFTIPQGSNTLIANMALVTIAALVTMFGIGAEIGIASVLTFLSDAVTTGQWVGFILILLVAAFALYYGATAIRTLTDPQPGSSMSATSGTSFTL